MPKIRSSYQLHVQLCDTKPTVWRRLAVADSTTLAQLHQTIQAAMGWENRQRYAFEIAGQRYGMPDADWPDDPTMDARRYTIGQLLQGCALPVRYLYDFADGWVHRIKLETCTPVGSDAAWMSLPMCLGGRNACPPEGCGGTTGFTNLLESMQDLRNTAHPGHRFARRQHATGWDAKHFDVHHAQARIHALELIRTGTPSKTKPEPVLT